MYYLLKIFTSLFIVFKLTYKIFIFYFSVVFIIYVVNVIINFMLIVNFLFEYICWIKSLKFLNYLINLILFYFDNYFFIRRCPVPPLSSPPVSLGKSWSLTILLKKIYNENFRYRNYFKKNFLNFSFHYVRYWNHLVTFLEKFSHQFAFASSQSS